MRLVVVDSNDLFRTGVTAYLRTQSDIDVVGQASTTTRGIRLSSELRPDVVTVDIDSDGVDGLRATRAITQALPATRVVALTSSLGPAGAEAVRAGACCMISRTDPVTHIAAAVRAAAVGACWLSAPLATELLGQIRDAMSDHRDLGLEPLSEREMSVLKLIAAGMDNTQIADALAISPNTAKSHVSSLLRKLNLPNRIQAATYAVRNNLV